MTREELILGCLKQVARLLWSLAQGYGLEREDLYQEAAVLAAQYVDQAMEKDRPGAYLYVRVAGRLKDYALRWKHLPSLDAPLSGDSDLSLLDTLAAPSPAVDDSSRQEEIEAFVHAALHRLPLDVQEYVRESRGLNAFVPSGSVPTSTRSRRTLIVAASRGLRKVLAS